MSSKGVNLPLTGSTCKPKSSRVVTPRSMGAFSVAMATRDVMLFPSIVMYTSETGYSTIIHSLCFLVELTGAWKFSRSQARAVILKLSQKQDKKRKNVVFNIPSLIGVK